MYCILSLLPLYNNCQAETPAVEVKKFKGEKTGKVLEST
jgi:hypothetical protein